MQALKSFLKSDDFLQCFYNVVMTIPLGIYLRYYFKCGFFKTVFIGFCVSLFFELTQYSALFGIYPKPYRYTEVDDLINNTLGALTGFLIEPVFARLIPGRDEIDRLSYIKGERITFMRRLFAVIIDYVLFNLFFALTEAFFIPVNGVEISTTLIVWSIEMILYFIVLPVVLKARTPGQALLKLKLTAADGSSATPGMVIKRNILLYVVEFILMQASGTLLSGLVMVLLSWKSNSLKVILLYGAFCVFFVLAVLVFVLRCMRKHDAMPHSYFSHTKEVSY